ncbi:hypothetical protein HAX54_041690 [Datura stramonium]|uniref:Uncharacterized protein n=1 Tax=Datura stramonium TaxID=4076 RepID=A0ABS8W155_DATST|nr:hypothetical protein [Datura stramonium]
MEEVNDAQNVGSNRGDEHAQDVEQKSPVKGNAINKEVTEVSSQASQGSVTAKKQVVKEVVVENVIVVWQQEEMNEADKDQDIRSEIEVKRKLKKLTSLHRHKATSIVCCMGGRLIIRS